MVELHEAAPSTCRPGDRERSCWRSACGSDATAAPLVAGRIRESAVQVAATGCRAFEVHGAGMMVGDGRIATVAHVVAGATRLEVRGAHGNAEATVVYFDPVLDVAVLKVDPAWRHRSLSARPRPAITAR